MDKDYEGRSIDGSSSHTSSCDRVAPFFVSHLS